MAAVSATQQCSKLQALMMITTPSLVHFKNACTVGVWQLFPSDTTPMNDCRPDSTWENIFTNCPMQALPMQCMPGSIFSYQITDMLPNKVIVAENSRHTVSLLPANNTRLWGTSARTDAKLHWSRDSQSQSSWLAVKFNPRSSCSAGCSS